MDVDILQLVSQAKCGDSQAFGSLYNLFAQRIFRYISIKVKDPRLAEDILQDVFVKAWQGLPKLDLVELNFSAWLYKIAGNCINDYFRKKFRNPILTDLDEAVAYASQDNLCEQLMVEADIAMVKSAFDKLTSEYRQILELRFIQDFSVTETAKILKKNSLSVRVLQHRALKKLKSVLEKNYALEY